MVAAVTAECDGYLAKPFSPARLKKEILKLLSAGEPAENHGGNGNKGSSAFLHQVQNDPGFVQMAQACASDEERKAFLRQEGFFLSPEELDAALLSWPAPTNGNSRGKAKELRSSPRCDVFLKVLEVNGQPIRDTVLLDLSMWGAKIESVIPFRDNVEVTFSCPGGDGKTRLSAAVVWWEQVPISKRYHVGMQFSKPLERLHRDGKFNLEQFWTGMAKRNEEIAGKNFSNIHEFADTLGVHWCTVWRQTAEKRLNFQKVKAGCKICLPPSEPRVFQGNA
jgi:hypothetical protein